MSVVSIPTAFRGPPTNGAADRSPPRAIARYRQAAHAGFDLLLSGHTHGGQITLD